MAVSDRFICAVCSCYINIYIKDESVYFLCGHIEHAECYLGTHPDDTDCTKCGAESWDIIFKYVDVIHVRIFCCGKPFNISDK